MKRFAFVLSSCIGLLLMSFVIYSCASAQVDPKTYTVEIKDMKFVPESITVNKGDTIIWINKDIVPHDVTEEKQKVWTSSVIPADGSWKMAVTEAADYYCSIHVVMKGKIVLN